jgi:hypothetical protein
MAGERDFTSDQWLTMQTAMAAAGVLVSVSEGGKAGDMLKEMFAVTQLVGAARRSDPNQLIRELASMRNFQSGWRAGESRAERDQYEREALTAIREATAIITARSPEDLEPFRGFLVTLAEAAANANVEGGFMGMGGVRVSDSELATIGRIKDALGLGR